MEHDTKNEVSQVDNTTFSAKNNGDDIQTAIRTGSVPKIQGGEKSMVMQLLLV